MATTVTIDSVTTADSAPVVAPHRISSQATKNSAAIAFTPTHDGVYVPSTQLVPPFTPGSPAPILAVMIRDGGSTPYTGTEVGRKGYVCSDSQPCSDTGPACTDWESPSGTQLTEDATYAELAALGTPTEGSHTINLYVAVNGQGWV